MKIIDNFELFRPWFNQLKTKEDFYFVQIIQRKKDGNELPSYTSGARTLRSFYFFDLEHFEREEQHIKEICDKNNARAYFWVNVRNTKEIAFDCAKRYIELIEQGNTNQGLAVWDRACGSNNARSYDKLWIVDIDQPEYLEIIMSNILNCRGSENRIKYTIPTISGYHLLCTGFDRNQFSDLLNIKMKSENDFIVPNIHKNNPTLLYYKSCSD